MARPTLWRFGDAANLYTDREVPLTVAECICRVESLVFQMDHLREFVSKNMLSGARYRKFRDTVTPKSSPLRDHVLLVLGPSAERSGE